MTEEQLLEANRKKTMYKAFLIGGSFIILSTLVIFAIKTRKK
jgi:hypothetical protein